MTIQADTPTGETGDVHQAGIEPTGAKDDVPPVAKKAETLDVNPVNPSSPGDTGTTPGSTADVG